MTRKIILLGIVAWLLGACSPGTDQPPVADSWTKIDADGQPLADLSDQAHHCVLDERTGLMWEVKRDETGLHHPAHTFSWYSTDEQAHMTEPGLADGGDCALSRCDTEGFVEAVNEAGLCGFQDWYLPRRDELMTLGDRRLIDEQGLVIDTGFFPHTIAGEYWTAETFRLYPQSAWAVDARNGLDRADYKTESKAVRLTRRHQPPIGEMP